MRPRAGRRSSISRFGPRRKRLARPHPPQRLLSPGSDLVSPCDPVKVKWGPPGWGQVPAFIIKTQNSAQSKGVAEPGTPRKERNQRSSGSRPTCRTGQSRWTLLLRPGVDCSEVPLQLSPPHPVGGGRLKGLKKFSDHGQRGGQLGTAGRGCIGEPPCHERFGSMPGATRQRRGGCPVGGRPGYMISWVTGQSH